MNLQAAILFAAAAALAYFTWRARRSGLMMNRYGSLERSEHPKIFRAAIVVRVGMAMFCFVMGAAAAMGWGHS
jgi:hypothetical protein